MKLFLKKYIIFSSFMITILSGVSFAAEDVQNEDWHRATCQRLIESKFDDPYRTTCHPYYTVIGTFSPDGKLIEPLVPLFSDNEVSGNCVCMWGLDK